MCEEDFHQDQKERKHLWVEVDINKELASCIRHHVYYHLSFRRNFDCVNFVNLLKIEYVQIEDSFLEF